MQVIENVRGLLESVFGAVFMVANAEALEEGAARMQPALAVLDLTVARGNLDRLVERLHRASPHTHLIALTIYELPTVATAALAAGVEGVVLKRVVARDLLAAVDAVLRGESFVTPELAARPAGLPEP